MVVQAWGGGDSQCRHPGGSHKPLLRIELCQHFLELGELHRVSVSPGTCTRHRTLRIQWARHSCCKLPTCPFCLASRFLFCQNPRGLVQKSCSKGSILLQLCWVLQSDSAPFSLAPCFHSLGHFINKYWESVRVQDSCPRYNDKEDNPTVTDQRKTKNWADLSMTLAEKQSACTRDLWKRLLFILSWSRCSLCTVVYCRHIILWLQWSPCGWMRPHLSHILLKSWALYWKQ